MPDAIVRSGIGHLAEERPRSEDIGPLRLVASLTRDGDRLLAQVCPESLEPSDFLAGARGEDNRVEIRLADGGILRLGGKGAGRWPTTVTGNSDSGLTVGRPAIIPGEDTVAIFIGWENFAVPGRYVFKYTLHGTLDGDAVDLTASSPPLIVTE